MNQLQFDELNTLKQAVNILVAEGQRIEVIEDTIEDLLIMSYVFGEDTAKEELQTDRATDLNKLEQALDKTYEDETWRDRIREHYIAGDLAGIENVMDTESHRMYNTGGYDVAETVDGAMKQWVTMYDDRVRPTHIYLEGEAVPLDERFYTYDGDSARFPGDFTLASNNCNCRCELRYTRG